MNDCLFSSNSTKVTKPNYFVFSRKFTPAALPFIHPAALLFLVGGGALAPFFLIFFFFPLFGEGRA